MSGIRTVPGAMIATFLVLAWGCTGGDDAGEEAARQATVDSVAMADSAYTPAVFDTIEWESQGKAIERGAVVWSYSCAKCHGTSGRGDTTFVMQGDTLRPPSLVAEEWTYADDPGGLREMIFVGAERGMPHWGIVGLGPRDIDAVAIYINEAMREK